MLDKQVDDRWFHLGPGSWNVSPRSDMQVVHVSEIPDPLDVLMMERHTVSLPVWPLAELLDEGCSFSDFVCMLCSALRGGSVRKNPKHTVSWDTGR